MIEKEEKFKHYNITPQVASAEKISEYNYAR